MTLFPDDGNRKIKVLLYQLESLGIIRFVREKEGKFQKYYWSLTLKGRDLVEKDEELKKLLEESRFIEFCQKVIYRLSKH